MPFLVLDLRGNDFSFSLLSMMFVKDVPYMAFCMLREVTSMPTFWRVFFFFFYHKWVLNFVKSFLCIYWDGYITFIIQFVDVVCRWFVDVEISLNPWDTPTWLCCMMLLMCCWIWFASTCWRFLCLCSSVVLGSIFLVFVVSLSGFAIRVMVIS